MLTRNWLMNPENVTYCNETDILPYFARAFGIDDLKDWVDRLRAEPNAEGFVIKGKNRTAVKLFIPNLVFQEPIEMGENVWIYLGEMYPAYCLYIPWDTPAEGEKA